MIADKMKNTFIWIIIVIGLLMGYSMGNVFGSQFQSPTYKCQDEIRVLYFPTLKDAQKWIKLNRKTIRAPQIRVLKDFVEVTYRERICQ
jgi:hypothetical protein